MISPRMTIMMDSEDLTLKPTALLAPGQARVAVHENEDGGSDHETDHSDKPQWKDFGDDGAGHEGGEQGDRDRVGGHSHRPPCVPCARLLIRRGVRLHSRHLLLACLLPLLITV